MTEYPNIRIEKHLPKDSTEKTTRFRLTEDCHYLHQGQSFVIPAGFLTDFSSVPRATWALLPPHGLATRASIKHDHLYDHRILDDVMGTDAARKAADRAFFSDMLADSVPFWQAAIMYGAVRLFGRQFWID